MVFPFCSRHPRVAVVRLSGVIAAKRGGLGGGSFLNIQALGPVLDRAFAVKRLAGVMLVINSPGGSPAQSSLIATRIRQLAAEKKVPVVACVEDAAASGGYWLACAADEIVADATSILGSIGVITAGFGLQELIARFGVERRLHTAGTEKSFLDPFRPERPEDLARLEHLLAGLHDEFKGWVRERRAARLKLPEDEAFTGRFWTGREAVAVGIADRIGDLDSEIKRRFGEKARVLNFGEKRRPLLARLLGGGAAALGEGVLAAAEERASWSRLGL